jgi:hypothetical protein
VVALGSHLNRSDKYFSPGVIIHVPESIITFLYLLVL